MAVKPWWLPEGVEPQQVIDLYESGLSSKKVMDTLGFYVNPKTLLVFLRDNGVNTAARHINCISCGSKLDIKGPKQKYCKECVPNQNLARTLSKHKITKSQYDLMFESQMGLCDLCELPLGIDVHIDHCHKQGHVRALLHRKCNTGLHYLEDDKFVAQAFRYIERHKR